MTSETPSPRLAGELSDQAYTETRAPYFRKPVTRLLPTARMSARELFVVAHGAGGPLRTLSEVYLNWEHMLSRTNQAAWLAIAGAYVPFGLGETLCAMMRMRAFDVLVTTITGKNPPTTMNCSVWISTVTGMYTATSRN